MWLFILFISFALDNQHLSSIDFLIDIIVKYFVDILSLTLKDGITDDENCKECLGTLIDKINEIKRLISELRIVQV